MFHHLSRAALGAAVRKGWEPRGPSREAAPRHLGRHCPLVAPAAPGAEGAEGASPPARGARWKIPPAEVSLFGSLFPCSPPMPFPRLPPLCTSSTFIQCPRMVWPGRGPTATEQGGVLGVFICTRDTSLRQVLFFAPFVLGRFSKPINVLLRS